MVRTALFHLRFNALILFQAPSWTYPGRGRLVGTLNTQPFQERTHEILHEDP
jgi:hypothetical protein